jgi:L-aspartate oxidase
VDADVLVIGSGVAGCTAALELAQEGYKVILATKADKPEESNTYHAQGGIIYKGKNDHPDLLANDILAAGAGASWPPAAQIIAQEGPTVVERILLGEVQVPFNRDETGELDFTKEAAHSIRRIIHSDDFTGKAIEIAMMNHISKIPNILANFTTYRFTVIPSRCLSKKIPSMLWFAMPSISIDSMASCSLDAAMSRN